HGNQSSSNISSIRIPNSRPSRNANGSDGSYFPVSIAFTLCRDTSSLSASSACDQPFFARSSRSRFFIATSSLCTATPRSSRASFRLTLRPIGRFVRNPRHSRCCREHAYLQIQRRLSSPSEHVQEHHKKIRSHRPRRTPQQASHGNLAAVPVALLIQIQPRRRDQPAHHDPRRPRAQIQRHALRMMVPRVSKCPEKRRKIEIQKNRDPDKLLPLRLGE